MKQEQNEYIFAVENLKAHLRAQNVTYRELARAIGMSESGVKKILSATDGSFHRLSQMCRYIGISIAELLDGGPRQMAKVEFNKQVQDFFLNEPVAFLFYWRLVYERQALDQAEKETELASKDSFKLLRQFDKLGLLQLLPGGRIRVPPVRQIQWVARGPLIKKLYKEWGLRLFQSVAGEEAKESKLFIIRYFKVFPKTYREFVQSQKDLEVEFVRRAIQDMRTESPELQHLRWMVAVDDQSFLS